VATQVYGCTYVYANLDQHIPISALPRRDKTVYKCMRWNVQSIYFKKSTWIHIWRDTFHVEASFHL